MRAVEVVKGLNKHKGNASALAREKGVTPQAIAKQIKQPEVQEVMQTVIEQCLKKAGITTTRVYGQLSAQLNAKRGKNKDWMAQDRARESALELMKHKMPPGQKEQTKPTEIHLHYGYRKPRVGAVRE